jgi:hypothetical protein
VAAIIKYLKKSILMAAAAAAAADSLRCAALRCSWAAVVFFLTL